MPSHDTLCLYVHCNFLFQSIHDFMCASIQCLLGADHDILKIQSNWQALRVEDTATNSKTCHVKLVSLCRRQNLNEYVKISLCRPFYSNKPVTESRASILRCVCVCVCDSTGSHLSKILLPIMTEAPGLQRWLDSVSYFQAEIFPLGHMPYSP